MKKCSHIQRSVNIPDSRVVYSVQFEFIFLLIFMFMFSFSRFLQTRNITEQEWNGNGWWLLEKFIEKIIKHEIKGSLQGGESVGERIKGRGESSCSKFYKKRWVVTIANKKTKTKYGVLSSLPAWPMNWRRRSCMCTTSQDPTLYKWSSHPR